MDPMIDRRSCLRFLALTGLQIQALGCRPRASRAPVPRNENRLGPLVPDPAEVLDLPAGFRAVVLQRAGRDALDDGRPIPGRFDGMTCAELSPGRWVLLRNHELGDEAFVRKNDLERQGKALRWTASDRPHNPELFGGVSRIELDTAALIRNIEGEDVNPVRSTRMVLTGTDTNCAGGRWPDGWISCEESSDRPGHGYAFHVPAQLDQLPTRIDTWGRLKREAIALASDGTIYMTEDAKDGAFYRFRPSTSDPFGPGQLEVLVVPRTRHTQTLPSGHALVRGEAIEVSWAPVRDPQAKLRPCRTQIPGATVFYRSEGVVWDGTSVWWTSTQGGAMGHGQLWRLTPGEPDRLELALEVTDPSVLSLPDNLALAPWGDILLCEDNYGSDEVVTHQYLRGIDRQGAIYDLARNPKNHPRRKGDAPGDEFTGACFSPDGRVLFVNLQGQRDETLAITGPWPNSPAA